MKSAILAVALALTAVSSKIALPLVEPSMASPQAAVEITVRTVGHAKLPSGWDVLIRPSAAQQEPAVRHLVHAAEPLRVQLPPESSWEISADLPGFWVPRKTLVTRRAGETAHIELEPWPLGKISGHIALQEKDVATPREVLVKTVAAPALLKRPPMPPGALTCPVDKQGNWSCSLPAATFDLVITAEGFTPHYRWGAEVTPAGTLGLGTFQLERGGSVAGWAAVEGGNIDPAHAVARLSLVAACDADAKSIFQLDRFTMEKPVTKDGFLQFTGLAAGTYALEVRQPGLATVRIADIGVVVRAETFLPQPLLLTRPIALELEIIPPLDERSEPWRAQVTRRAEDSRPSPIVFDGRADSEGRFTVADQSPGWFQVAIYDSRGNRVHSEPERQLDASARHKIELHRVAVDGRLRLGSEPLAATLWFGGRHGDKSVKMGSDAEGHFTGVLSSQRVWIVDVEATEPRFSSRTRTEVHSDKSGRSTITIDLPDTQVFGHIVDQHDRPAAQGFVSITTQGVDQTVQADVAGSFDVRGLSEGLVALVASDGSASQSERSVVNLAQGAKVGPLELRLRAIRHLKGTVLSQLGPVAGANIMALANFPAVGGGHALTGLDGTFSLELPANLDSFSAVVKAPGFGTQAFRLATTEEALALRMSEAAGQIAVALPRGLGDLQRDSLRVSLFQNGIEVPISALREDVSSSASASKDGTPVLRLSNLAPGDYLACIARKQVDSKGSLDRAPKATVSCDSGQLGSGLTLTLTLRENS